MRKASAGVAGATIGVDIDRAMTVRDILGYDTIVADETGTFMTLSPPGWSVPTDGDCSPFEAEERSFSQLFGSTIELVQALIAPKKLYEAPATRALSRSVTISATWRRGNAEKDIRSPWTATNGSRRATRDDMGDAAGPVAYIEDPDGTLIEFVETHKVPIAKKLGLSLNLKNRHPEKPLPKWMLKALSLMRVKSEDLLNK